MNICILAAGAAGMYCGSCLRDNALAQALIRAGHKVVLVPLYTPLRTDTPGAAIGEVFYGGINAWLQYASGLFRRTPRAIDWLMDRPRLLNFAGQLGAQTSPGKLGPFILSILRGEEGPQAKELRRLAAFLRDDVKPQVISLPNLMFIGAARLLRSELGVPTVCELTGEDIFLDAMAEPFQSEAAAIIRHRAGAIDRFVATSSYYADRMAEYLAVLRSKIAVVYPGVPAEFIAPGAAPASADRPPTIGYFARVCPEKGLDRLVEAFAIVRSMPGLGSARLRAGGYLGPAHRAWFSDLQRSVRESGLADAFEYVGEVDLAGKLAFLDSIDVLSVPAPYPEPKGMYILEGLARGRCVVQPAHGAFPELIDATGGGMLVSPGNPQALADALAQLLRDPLRRKEFGEKGRQAVRDGFTDDHMAARMLAIYQSLQK